MDHVTLVTPSQGRSVVRRLTIDIACKHTKFDDARFSRSERYFRGCEILKLAT